MSMQDDIFDITASLEKNDPDLVAPFNNILARLAEAESAERKFGNVCDAVRALRNLTRSLD